MTRDLAGVPSPYSAGGAAAVGVPVAAPLRQRSSESPPIDGFWVEEPQHTHICSASIVEAPTRPGSGAVRERTAAEFSSFIDPTLRHKLSKALQHKSKTKKGSQTEPAVDEIDSRMRVLVTRQGSRLSASKSDTTLWQRHKTFGRFHDVYEVGASRNDKMQVRHLPITRMSERDPVPKVLRASKSVKARMRKTLPLEKPARRKLRLNTAFPANAVAYHQHPKMISKDGVMTPSRIDPRAWTPGSSRFDTGGIRTRKSKSDLVLPKNAIFHAHMAEGPPTRFEAMTPSSPISFPELRGT